MVTHSDDGPFWSVVKRGMDDACAAVGVSCVWAPSVNTPEKQVQDIDAAIAAGSDGIAISLASPDQVGPAALRVTEAGIPLYTLNSGLNQYIELGAVTHVGQTEFVAGQGAGLRFNDLGVRRPAYQRAYCIPCRKSQLTLRPRPGNSRKRSRSFAGSSRKARFSSSV